MNILLTCAGRRNYLVDFFKEAVGKDTSGQVLACDSSPDAPALAQADQTHLVPRMDDPSYFNALLTICREQRVRLLVSVNDSELAGLAHHAPRFREVGTIPVVSSPQVIATCQDKWAAFEWLKSCDLPTPDTYLTLADARQALAQGAIDFPLMIKPRWGTSSIGVERVENSRELDLAYEWGVIQAQRSMLAGFSRADPQRCLIIQQCLQGQEYGLDVVNDFHARHAGTLARRKRIMRAGNTDRAVTVNEPRLERLGAQIAQRLGHVGCLDCDVMASGGRFCVLDMNPRLGGGYPFSHLAGANLPAAFIAWADGAAHDPAWLESRANVLVSKFDGMAVMDEPAPFVAEFARIPTPA